MFFIRKRLERTKKIKFGKKVLFNRASVFEGRNYLSTNAKLIDSHIGFASYIGANSDFRNAHIGKYTSIGPNVLCILGNHPSNTFVSTHPAFFSTRKQVGFSYTEKPLFEEFAKPLKENTNYSIVVGNDVWIGANTSIIDGVTIGDGAIIAANSLINKDIPPFTIYGGVPAKLIKERFQEDEKKFLIDFKWWEKGDEWIAANAQSFTDIMNFHKKFKKNG